MDYIAMVPGSDNNPFSGPSRHVYEISTRLGKMGFSIVNILVSKDGSSGLRLVDDSYLLLEVSASSYYHLRTNIGQVDRYLGRIWHYYNYKSIVGKLTSKLEPAILHTHGFCTVSQPKKSSFQRLTTIHAFGQIDMISKEGAHFKPLFLNSLLKKIYRNSDHCTTFSPTMKQMAVHLYGMEPDKISIVPHGVNASFFSESSSGEVAALSARYNIKKPIRVLFLGHLLRGKGLDILLQAFKILVGRRHDVKLLIKSGLGADYYDTKRKIDMLNLNDCAQLIGDRLSEKELRALYKASTMFVNFHMLSGYSTALLEAMASGVPSIIYRKSPNADIVDSSCGVLLETLSPVELANAIEMIADDEKLARNMGCNAQKKAMAEFDWDKVVVPKYAAVYKSLVDL